MFLVVCVELHCCAFLVRRNDIKSHHWPDGQSRAVTALHCENKTRPSYLHTPLDFAFSSHLAVVHSQGLHT